MTRRHLAAMALGAVMAIAIAPSSYASTTLTLPPPGPATGHTCSSSIAYVGSVGLVPIPPALRGLPVPIAISDNLSSKNGLLATDCGDVSTGSSAQGVMTTASTSFDVSGQLAMTNNVAQTDSAVPQAFRESAETDGDVSQMGSMVPPVTPQTESLSITYTYEVLAESYENAHQPDIVTVANLDAAARCENANFPQGVLTGEDQSHEVGSHTVTVTYTCPVGRPLQLNRVDFGIFESQHLFVAQGTGIRGSASTHVATRWDGGTLTLGP